VKKACHIGKNRDATGVMKILPVGFLVVACVAEPETVSGVEQAANGCGFVCGTNSPIAGGWEFYELDAAGAEAPSGFRITSFRDALDVAMQIDVQGFHLRGIKAGPVTVSGIGLVGAKLVVERPDGAEFEITIDSVAFQQRYYESGDDGTLLPSYGMTVKELSIGARPRRLCQVMNTDTIMFQAGPWDALVFGGERFDRKTGKVYATGSAAGRWFNVACLGDTLSKALVARYAEPANDAAHDTDRHKDTAFIRMMRADFCGDAVPHTVLGTPLDWANAGLWMHLNQALTPANIEAIWTHEGAVCLTNPRLPPGPMSCAPLPCTPAQIANPFAYGELVSLKP
jgi:hypothetical protein